MPSHFNETLTENRGCAHLRRGYKFTSIYLLADCFDQLSKYLVGPSGAPRRFLCQRFCARDLLPVCASERAPAGEEVIWGCVREFDLLQQSGRDRDVMAAPWSPQPEVSADFRVRCLRSPLRRSVGGTVQVARTTTCCVSEQVFGFLSLRTVW